MRAIHYSLSVTLPTACGRYVGSITARTELVTCKACRKTVKFHTEWFTRDLRPLAPLELSTGRARRTKRQGARP